jgi:thioredoxin 1
MNLSQHNPATLEVGGDDFQAKVLGSKQPVLVVFWAPWSRPCQVLGSVLDDVAIACGGTATVVKVNADDNPDLSLWYDIQSIPTVLYFVSGGLRAKLVGTASKEAILAKLQRVLEGGESTSSVNS